MNWYALVWFILMIVFVVTEVATVGLVSVWFAVGALAATVTALLGGELWLQAVLFAVVSGALLALLRPFARKFFQPKLTKTNVDAVVGSRGVVLEEINNLGPCGRVKLDAMEWSARSTGGDVIPAGTVVCVDRVEGVKLFVTPAETFAAK